MRTYRESLEFLFSLGGAGVKLGLERIEAFCKELGYPQKSYPVIIVGGTNGKGSVVTMISSMLNSAGFRVGRILSPHIADFGERISIDGEPVSSAFLVEFLDRYDGYILENRVSFFETVTAMALEYFRREKVTAAVIEVGMGGRLDASNVCDSSLAVVTSIGLDHVRSLGNTPELIAGEKIRISRDGGLLVTGALDKPIDDFFSDYSAEHEIHLRRLGKDAFVEPVSQSVDGTNFIYTNLKGEKREYNTALTGFHQAINAGTSLLAMEVGSRIFRAAPEELASGLRKAFLPGRLQVIRREPPVVIDVSHNAAGAEALAASMKSLFPGIDFTVMFGVKGDKDFLPMLDNLSKVGYSLTTVRPAIERPREPEEIALAGRRFFRDVEVLPDVKDAVRKALDCQKQGQGLLITGSFHTVGEALPVLAERGCRMRGLKIGENLSRLAI